MFSLVFTRGPAIYSAKLSILRNVVYYLHERGALTPDFIKGQDWSGIWLQQFSGTITIWPKTRISDFWYILSDPTPERLARMLSAGQQSTFPKLLFLQNRMKIERLIEEGLLLGGSGKADMRDIATSSRESMHMRGQAMRSTELSTNDEHGPYRLQKENRRASVIQELKRQSGVFFDDSEIDGEGSGGSEDETAIALEDTEQE